MVERVSLVLMEAFSMDTWLTISGCAKRVHKSSSTIRRLVLQNLVSSRKDSKNRYLVNLQDILNHYSQEPIHETSMKVSNDIQSEYSSQLVEGLKAQIELLERSLEREVKRNERLENGIDNLQREVHNLTCEIKALLKDDKQGWQIPFRWKRN